MPAISKGSNSRSRYSCFAMLFLFFSIIACSSAEPVATSSPVMNGLKDPGLTSQAAKKEDWHIEWDIILAGAKKEGKVVVYSTAPGEVRSALQNGFKKTYGLKA